MKITFPDNGDDDFAILQRFNPIPLRPTERAADVDGCIFHRFLENESDVYVTVTGCPESDAFEVTTKKLNLQCVSRIWASLTLLYFVRVVRF